MLSRYFQSQAEVSRKIDEKNLKKDFVISPRKRRKFSPVSDKKRKRARRDSMDNDQQEQQRKKNKKEQRDSRAKLDEDQQNSTMKSQREA